ncbi:class 1 fructose-bisphosphatase [Cellvibrio sp. OA-2007]|uniref:class 1 fructose-bisphosphatase n=1 Tax=Cellvibrio sp. OA-2007 TaxID=529823 RepID=UPI0007818ABB|nr:class 1 fructose-bisphosphatase [Cellvibrio sp. OA-2007]
MQDLENCLNHDKASAELKSVVTTLIDVTKEIAFAVRQGALAGVLGSAQVENVQGETQKKLDVIANDLLKSALSENSCVRALASEEEEHVVALHQSGKYIVAFDPLDGSSNIDINGQIGTIFTIYPALENVAADSPAQFFQLGKNQLCAGYVLYGASTLLVLTSGGPTRCFTLDPHSNEWVLTNAQLQVPQNTQEFSINMANQRFWSDNFKRYVADLLLGETGVRGKRFNMRWNAAMVGDVHRVLTRGGIFMYPNDNRNPRQPAKLRLLYEANPMALLIENAGGKACSEAMNKIQRILEITPESLHQRVSVVLGSANEVDICNTYLFKRDQQAEPVLIENDEAY